MDCFVWLAGNYVPTTLGQLSPLNKSSWGKCWDACGKAASQHAKGFRKNQPSEGVQSLLPELKADLCLCGETRLQRNNSLVLRLNEKLIPANKSSDLYSWSSTEDQMSFGLLFVLQQWQNMYLFDWKNVFLASEGNTEFHTADIKIISWSVTCSVYLLLSNIISPAQQPLGWGKCLRCHTLSSDQHIFSAFVCFFTSVTYP